MKKLVIHGCYHTQNFGDRLLHDILRDRLARKFQTEPTTLFTYENPKPGILGLAKRLASSRRNDFAVFGGGGYFVSSSPSITKMMRYSVPAFLWRKASVPYAVVGVGVGPNLKGRDVKMVQNIFKHSRLSFVRDESSKQVLNDAGIDTSNISVGADLVFTLEPNTIPTEAMEEARQLLQPDGRRILGMHFRHAAECEQSADIARILNERVNFEKTRLIWFFDHTDKGASALRELSNNYLPKAEMIPFQDYWTTAAMISQMDGVWTTKLHVGIVASVLRKPVYGYSAHGKTKRFFQQIGRDDFHREMGSDPTVFHQWIDDFQSETPLPIDVSRLSKLRDLAETSLTELENEIAMVKK